MIQRKIHIRQRLRLHSLRRIHNQDRSVTGCKASGYLIVKVYMSRRIDQVKDILLSVIRLIYRTHSLCFDGDSSLSFQVHIIQNLRLHLTACQKSGLLDDPVCKRRFSMVDMCDNTKISYFILIN